MSVRIDLTPPSCRQRMVRRAVARRWITAYGAVAALIVLIVLPIRVSAVAKRAHLSWLQREAALDADYERQLKDIQRHMDRLTAIATRYESVAWPINLTDVISVIGDVMPDSVSLTSLNITPRMQRQRVGETARTPAGVIIELGGVAPTDLEVATLIAGFEAHSVFDRVRIDHSRPTTVRGVEAREFGATCEIEFATRRLTAGAPTKPAGGGR